MDEYQIGKYTITCLDENSDEFEIKTKLHDGGRRRTVVCCGDIETALDTLFIGNDVEIKWSHELNNNEQ